MKHIQVIDSAINCSYSLYAVDDSDFAIIFPKPGQNVEFMEEIVERLGETLMGQLVLRSTTLRMDKTTVVGIRGTLFFGLLNKRKYYPNKRDDDIDGPALLGPP